MQTITVDLNSSLQYANIELFLLLIEFGF